MESGTRRMMTHIGKLSSHAGATKAAPPEWYRLGVMSGGPNQPLLAGRYAIFDRIAAGGMAAVHIGRLAGEGGFARIVAVKRLHPQFALDPEFVAMFLDEARLAARIRHPNVVQTLDIVAASDELFLVMEYVEGESLGALMRRLREQGARAPVEVAAGVMVQVLHGLHAAHEANNDLGEPLDLVHRDVSPQNVLVGADGVARVLDFGVAKALGKMHTTREGQLKGKLGYLSPEQVFGHPVTRRSDVFAAGVVLWEAITGERLFAADSEGDVLRRIMEGTVDPPSQHAPHVPSALDAAVMRAVSRQPADRFDTALVMAEAIEAAIGVASSRAIGAWLHSLAGDTLKARAQFVAAVEGCAIPASSSPTPALLDGEAATVLDSPEKRTQTSISLDSLLPPETRERRRKAVVFASVLALGALATGAGLLAQTRSLPWQRSAHQERPQSAAAATATPSFVSEPAPARLSATGQEPASEPVTTAARASTSTAPRPAPHAPRAHSVPVPRPSPPPSAAVTAASLYSRE